MTASAPSPDQTAADRDDDVLVRISNVTKYYGRFKALDDVSLDIHRGEEDVVESLRLPRHPPW